MEEIISAREARFGIAQRIGGMDRGMVSADTLAWVQATGRRDLVGTPKSELRKWARALPDAREGATVRDGVDAKPCPGPDGTETFVLVRSVERRAKAQAIHTRFGQPIAARLTRARRPGGRGRLARPLGRLLGQNPRAAGRSRSEVGTDPTVPAGLRLTWTGRPSPSGGRISNSPMPRRPSAARRANWGSAPSGRSAPTASQRRSSSASWPTSAGKRWSSGSARARSPRHSTASSVPM